MYNNYSSTYYSSSADVEAIAGIAAGVLSVFMIIAFAVLIVELIGLWKTFTKAGEAGWKCLIPIYNLVILFKISGISPWLVLCYLLTAIPVVGSFVALGLQVYLSINLSKAFGRSGAFAVGLFFLQPIFICILGFGNSEYQGTAATQAE